MRQVPSYRNSMKQLCCHGLEFVALRPCPHVNCSIFWQHISLLYEHVWTANVAERITWQGLKALEDSAYREESALVPTLAEILSVSVVLIRAWGYIVLVHVVPETKFDIMESESISVFFPKYLPCSIYYFPLVVILKSKLRVQRSKMTGRRVGLWPRLSSLCLKWCLVFVTLLAVFANLFTFYLHFWLSEKPVFFYTLQNGPKPVEPRSNSWMRWPRELDEAMMRPDRSDQIR